MPQTCWTVVSNGLAALPVETKILETYRFEDEDLGFSFSFYRVCLKKLDTGEVSLQVFRQKSQCTIILSEEALALYRSQNNKTSNI